MILIDQWQVHRQNPVGMTQQKTDQNELEALLSSAAKNLAVLADSAVVKTAILQSVNLIVDSYKKGGILYICGNGGSAADAQAMATELMVKLHKDRSPIRAIALTTDSSVLTAMGNDFGYEYLFHRQIQALMRKEDVLFAISTSGNSPNVIHALKACRKLGGKSILMSGFGGGKAAPEADLQILAPGAFAGPIQECHLVIYHSICTLVEQRLVELGLCSYGVSYASNGSD